MNEMGRTRYYDGKIHEELGDVYLYIDGSIDDIIQEFQKIKDKHKEKKGELHIDTHEGYEGETCYNLILVRDETPEETKKREKESDKMLTLNRNVEIEEYQRLKKKYGE